ncbi:MAG: response regulator [Chloroflexota bacterium]
MANNKILIVEDDRTLLDVVRYNLAKEGYEVHVATDGIQAIEVTQRERPDLMILDIMLPELDGFEVCRILRRKEMALPILMLTAKTDEVDKVVGLELGADDYLTKPFSVKELVARVRAMLRRVEMTQREYTAIPETQPIVVGDLEIDVARHQVSRGGSPVTLSPKEFELLSFLAKTPGQVFTRDTLLDRVWGYDYAGDTRTVDVHIRWLRQKIEPNPDTPTYLVTVRGVGYKFQG